MPLLLTAQLVEGDKATLHLLGAAKVPSRFPLLRQAQESRVVHFREVHINETIPQIHSDSKNKRKDREWLPVLVKEALGASPG